MIYTPDRWLILKITSSEETLYKVFASWYGGYLSGDSWKMNSGIESFDIKEDYYIFKGYSASKYICYKHSYGMSGYGGTVIGYYKSNKEGVIIEVIEDQPSEEELIELLKE